MGNDGNWDEHCVASIFPSSIASLILNNDPPGNSIMDSPRWKGAPDGVFFASAYTLIQGNPDLGADWTWLWKLRLPQKLEAFLWTILHGKLLTNHMRMNHMRMKRGLTNDPTCPFCCKDEDITHLFRGRIKLNTDGCKKAGGEGGFGGLLRDERGAWVCGYYGRMQMATSLEAELWAVYKGLTVILQKGLYNVLIETDTAQVVKLMEEETADNCPFKSLVDDAKILLRGCECTIQHIWKEGNLCADALAKLRAAQPEDILVVNDPPAEIRGLLVRGMIGLSCERA